MASSMSDAEASAEQRVLGQLARLGVDHERVRIDPDLADTAAFCEHYGYRLEESANCIVVASRASPPRHAACVNLATTSLDVNTRVRALMEARKVSFADPDDVRELTGMALGGITPFGLPEDLPVYVDAAVVDRPRVVVGGGSRSLKVVVDPVAFERLERARIVAGLAEPA